MNWLTNFVRPKIQALVRNTRVRESLWEKCTACDQMIFHRELAERLQVCPHCGHHMFFRPMERMSHLFDQGEYEMLELPVAILDPLKFKDRKRYVDRLKEARAGAPDRDAIVAACGAISGFHGLVSSGTTSKQVNKNSDARTIGYGSMIGEAALSVAVIIASVAGISIIGQCELSEFPIINGIRFEDPNWHNYYDTWAHAASNKSQSFILGGSALLNQIGIPMKIGSTLISVLIISF